TVDYQPQVPQGVTINSPANGQLLKGEDESMPMELRASFALTKNQQPPKAAVSLNGRDEPARVDLASGTVTSKIALKPGVNQLRVKLSNEWGSTSLSDEVTVRYLRPPTILSIRAEEPKEGVPFVNVEARVHSATPLVPKSIQVYVNESERKPQIDIPDKPGEGNVWTLRLTNIPLDADGIKPTTNQITLRVSNDEAEAEKEGAAQVVYRPKQPPPTVEFIQPVTGVSVTRPDYKVRFQVESKTALEQVKLLHEKHEPISMDVAKAEVQPDGSFLLTVEIPLALHAGPNTLRLEALNKGGVQSSPPLEVNYIYRPVRVAVDNLISVRPGAKESPLKPQPGGEMAFDPQEEGRLRLRGRVLWDEADDQRLASAKVVRVYVNGFQQLPAVLQKPGDNPRERGFQTNLVLNRDKGNHIELALPDLAKVFNKNQFDFNVDCRKPERSQRLHLLIVSIQDKDPKPLEAQILNAFKGNGGGTSQAVKAFDPIYSYPTLVDYRVKPSYV
ncbi:MAG TPA: hypothetical protein VGX70_11170, partial [Gemmataceae bacterium]|nr:hypothetical protein [Gemmataceae bacterium]